MESGRPPVSQSPLYKNGRSLLPGLVNAREGLASAVADIERRASQAKILHNLQQCRKRAIWTSHDIGFVLHNENEINSGARILDFGIYYDDAGSLNILLQADDEVYPYDLTLHDVGAAITGLTGLDPDFLPCIRPYAPSSATAQPIAIYCNGDIEPRKITDIGTSAALGFTNSGGATSWGAAANFNSKTYSKPKFCEPFGDRMAYAGFSDPDTIFDVLISKQGNAESFIQSAPILATDAVAFTMPAVLGPITGVKSFRPSNTDIGQVFLVGQRDGVSMITGTNSTNYRVDILTNMYGIVNNRCFAQVLDDLVFLTSKGVFTFSSLIQNLTRSQDALSNPIGDQIRMIDFDNADAAFAVHHAITQELQFWVPFANDSGTNRRGLILCYNTDGGLQNPVWSTKDGFDISAGIDVRNVFYGGSYDGFVQQHYNGDTYDGEPILFRYVSSYITVGNVMQAGRIKQLTIATDGGAQKFSINVYAYVRYMDGSTRKILLEPSNYVLRDNVPGGTTLPFPLPSAFPSDHVKTFNYSPIGRGVAFEVELSNTQTPADGLDYSAINFTMSIGGLVRR
jgi:hypothetical protein